MSLSLSFSLPEYSHMSRALKHVWAVGNLHTDGERVCGKEGGKERKMLSYKCSACTLNCVANYLCFNFTVIIV